MLETLKEKKKERIYLNNHQRQKIHQNSSDCVCTELSLQQESSDCVCTELSLQNLSENKLGQRLGSLQTHQISKTQNEKKKMDASEIFHG